MKKIIYIIFSVLLVSCSQKGTESKAQTTKPVVKCQTEAKYGNINICNPEIVGMMECFSNERIKQRQETLALKGTITLAYYISMDKFKTIEKSEKLKISDIIKIYAPEAYGERIFETNQLNSMFSALKNNYISAKWDSLKLVLVNKNLDLEISQPLLIDSYSLNENAKSAAVFMRASNEVDEKYTVVMMNLIRCKKRLIFLSYYLEYTGIESVTKAKAKNDYIVLRFIEANQ